MRFFARIEVEPDDLPEDEDYPEVQRVADNDLDIALVVRSAISRAVDEHGHAWEATITIEPLTPAEGE
jgi:hypothetical protein